MAVRRARVTHTPHSSPRSTPWACAGCQPLAGSPVECCDPCRDPPGHGVRGFWLRLPGGGGALAGARPTAARDPLPPRNVNVRRSPPAAFMRGELTLARCLLPPISPIKNILPSRSARSSPGPQLYFINTFRQVQKGMIHAGPERS